MWLLASFFLISLIQFVSSEVINGQQNDIIPDQPLEIPEGYFCYFTMSELMFVDRMQQVAYSATRVGAARLSDMKIVTSSSFNPYHDVWGACYIVQREDYSKIIQYAISQNYISFVSTMDIETIENLTATCVVNDLGMQPNTYLYSQNCDLCNGPGESNGQPRLSDYQQELASMGVPDSFLQAMGNLSTRSSQNSSQQPTSSQTATLSRVAMSSGIQASTPSVGASATGQIPTTGALDQDSTPPFDMSTQIPSMSASAAAQMPGEWAQGLIPSFEASTQSSSVSALAAGQVSTAGATSQGLARSPAAQPQGLSDEGLAPTRKISNVGALVTGRILSAGESAIDQISGSGASVSGQMSSASAQGHTNRSLGTYSTSSTPSPTVYQPQTSFSAGSSDTGNSQQLQLVPGFTIASYSSQYSDLKPYGGRTFSSSQ